MNFLIFCILTMFPSFFACNFNPDKHIEPGWSMDFLGPLIKSKVNIQDINELADMRAKVRMGISDIYDGPSIGSVAVPSFVSSTLGPFSLDLTNNAFGDAEIKSGDLYYTITDSLQVNIASCDISIQQGNNILLNDHTGTIAKDGGIYTSPTTYLSNISINGGLTLIIKNLASNGSGGFVTIDPNRRLIIDVFVKNVRLKSIFINGSNSFTIADTSEFSIRSSNISAQSVSGTFTTYLQNNIPLNFYLQIYFLNNTKTEVLDSLFDNPTAILAGSISSPEIKLVTQLNNTKINHLNNSSYSKIELRLSNAGSTTIPDSLFFKMQVVGDLKIRLSK